MLKGNQVLIQRVRQALYNIVPRSRLTSLRPVNDGPAALWAIVELNLWVVVASIPALRPLVAKTFRDMHDRSSSYRSRSGGYDKILARGVVGRFWPSRSRSSDPSVSHLPFDGVEPGNAKLSQPAQNYNVEISAPATKQTKWTPLGTAGESKDDVQLSDLAGIRVDQEIKLSRPPKIYQK